MRKVLFLLAFYAPLLLLAQNSPVTKGNYSLAARFSPKKIDKMVFSTNVDAHWLKKADKFWYMYETSEGKKWYIVDPAKASKQLLFDNEKLAAAITRIVKDPFDAQHLSIDSLQFIKEETWIQFQVKSTEEIEKKDTTKKGSTPVKEKKTFYFEYNLATGRKIMDLEVTDLSRLFEAGYKFPQPFKVKADDGITDLYGVMYKPFDFDSTKKYPIIEYVYPGPQTEAVNKSFSRGLDRTDRLAQFGFIVITIGNRGGHPSRSKWR